MSKTNNESKRNVLGLSVVLPREQRNDETKTERKSKSTSKDQVLGTNIKKDRHRNVNTTPISTNDFEKKSISIGKTHSKQHDFEQKNQESDVSSKPHKETLSKKGKKQRLQNNSKKRHKSNSSNTKSAEFLPPPSSLLSSPESNKRGVQASESQYSHAESSSVADTSTSTTSIVLQQPATQFSVQRSDSDGLRMKISAIRPPNPQALSSCMNTIPTKNDSLEIVDSIPSASNTPEISSHKEKLAENNLDNKNNNNNNNIGLIQKSKERRKRHHQKQEEQQEATRSTKTKHRNSIKMESEIALPSSTSKPQNPILSSLSAPCLSDATESGCSTTTTTIAIVDEKSTKRIKIKRKKSQLKNNDVTCSSTKSHTYYRDGRQHNHQSHRNQQSNRDVSSQQTSSAFTSDTDDEVNDSKQTSKTIQKRAPRLLLTAINNKTNLSQTKSSAHISPSNSLNALSSGVPIPGTSDNIGISSSDNELPDLVNAAIKRVESDSDDDYADGSNAMFRKGKSKSLQQYQSTLLQDFMEKTQMLSHPTTSSCTAIDPGAGLLRLHEPQTHNSTEFPRTNSNSQTESIASSSGGVGGGRGGGGLDCGKPGTIHPTVSTKRRGRPKKGAINLIEDNTDISSNTLANAGVSGNINESGDSGVISTSTTLSMSPSPNVMKPLETTKTLVSSPSMSSQHHRHKRKASETSTNALLSGGNHNKNAFHESNNLNTKPKIDIAYLDKRMYAATERVLYPPPRNKRRQSMSAQKAGNINHTSGNGSMCKGSITKEELQLDPVWRKIDVNKKFRRPSVSGYKSDGGGGNLTICSKVLAAKSGYVSDYGHAFHHRQHHHHSSGYKSDASCKSRYSVKSCVSRRARAKSCGYRSDFRESCSASVKSSKFRRKRRASVLLRSVHSKSVGNLNDDQDILQLAGLSLGQSGSEESNEYVCKPSLESLPTTSVSKKYGEINRFITTGEYFGRGSASNRSKVNATTSGLKNFKLSEKAIGNSFQSLTKSAKRLHDDTLAREDALSQDDNCESLGGVGSSNSCQVGSSKQVHRKSLLTTDSVHELSPHITARKIKSRRSSAASYCSSYYSGTSKVRRRRRRSKTISSGRTTVIDSKLLTEIDILTSTFNALCRIHNSNATNAANSGLSNSAAAISGSSSIEKLNKDRMHGHDLNSSKFHGFNVALMSAHLGNPSSVSSAISTSSGNINNKREPRDKRNSKKRKQAENLDFALISAAASNAAAALMLTSSGSSGNGGSVGGTSKRRHKKSSGSSPDDHKLPLKKRHYIKTPGEKLTGELAAKIFANSTEAWAAAAAAAKSTATTKSQQHYAAGNNLNLTGASLFGTIGSSLNNASNASNTKGSKTGLTPKKRHLLQSDSDDTPLLPHLQHHSHHHHHLSTSAAAAISSGSSIANCNALLKGNTNINHNISPLRISIGCNMNTGGQMFGGFSEANVNSANSGKLLDISPLSIKSATSVNQSSETVHKKRSRLEGLVSKIAGGHIEEKGRENISSMLTSAAASNKSNSASHKGDYFSSLQLDPETSCPPPPGVFEPSIELEIQIPPPMTKLSESVGIITKSEVDSPLLLEMNKSGFASLPMGLPSATTKTETSRGVVESLLDKTGGNNLLLKRKRKKINRTGFPTVRRRKRKVNEQLLLDITPDLTDDIKRQKKKPLETKKCEKAQTPTVLTAKIEKVAEDEQGKITRTPRLSVVSLDRLKANNAVDNFTSETCDRTAHDKETNATRSTKKIKAKHRGTKNQDIKHAGIIETQTENKSDLKHELVSKPVKSNKKSKNSVVSEMVTSGTAATRKHKANNTNRNDKKSGEDSALNDTPTERKGRKSRANAIRSDEKKSKKDQEITSKPTSASLKVDSNLLKDSNKKSNLLSKCSQIFSSQKSSHQSGKITKTIKSECPAFTKSSVQKIITAKSLEGKVKLPAGLDPNTNFSCKIRLKRRNSLYPHNTEANSSRTSHNTGSAAGGGLTTMMKHSNNNTLMKLKIDDDCKYSNEEIEESSTSKDINIDYLEHDVLPPSEGPSLLNWQSEDFFLLDDDKLNNSATAQSRKAIASKPPVKKNYISAGLFSEYYKQDPPALAKSKSRKKITEPDEGDEANISVRSATATPTKSSVASVQSTGDSEAALSLPLLPPPPYCEAYFRRTQQDFQLPYDIWWAYTNSKLTTLITVPSWNYRKIRTNIYAESVRPNLAGVDHPICNCKADVGCGENCLNRMVYTECSPSSCPTREKCQNQKIQRHEVAPGVERFMTTDKGWGVRAKLPIAKGTYILEYVGEVVTEREFKDRMGTIYLSDIHHYCLHLDGGLVIDGHRMGSDGRFVNHSCMPNCEMQKWSVNGLSRMALFAKRNIEPGEEITYDYNFSLFNPSEGQPCRCNTPQCRGVIGGKSQRVKPLLNEAKSNDTNNNKEQNGQSGRQRKRKARKNAQRLQTAKVMASYARCVQPLAEKERKLAKQYSVFLVRNYEKIRRCRSKKYAKLFGTTPPSTPTASLLNSSSSTPSVTQSTNSQNAIANRRLSASPSLAAQISALCSPRNIKTRGLTMAAQDPELEKMAKMAIILRDICTVLDDILKESNSNEEIKSDDVMNSVDVNIAVSADIVKNKNESSKESVSTRAGIDDAKLAGNDNCDNNNTNKDNLNLLPTTISIPKKKKVSSKNQKTATSLEISDAVASPSSSTSCSPTAAVMGIANSINFKNILTNIEQGYYKTPKQFDDEIEKQFQKAQDTYRNGDNTKECNGEGSNKKALNILDTLMSTYKKRKTEAYAQLVEIIGDADALENFKETVSPTETFKALSESTSAKDSKREAQNNISFNINENSVMDSTSTALNADTADNVSLEDVIRCICGLSKDEGLMIQCAKCMAWQHTECMKADVNAENYMCEKCEPREVDREIALDDYTEEGHQYYLALLRGNLHIRQGDAVYVLRDIPIKDESGNIVPLKKHTYETIGNIDYNECDIFRVERLWKDQDGKRFIFGHHFLRPHETYHEPTRRFYPNEVVRVPLYEVVPIELVIGRCWVLDRTTFCKGRPIECTDDNHCYICELRVDKSARFFSKAKTNYPTCTKHYAFRKFRERLKISKTYAPHDVDPALMKSKKQKTDQDLNSRETLTHSAEQYSGDRNNRSSICSASNAIAHANGNHQNTTKQDATKALQHQSRKRKNNSPTIIGGAPKIHYISPIPPTLQTLKERRNRLENVLSTLKLNIKKTSGMNPTEKPLDLSYLLSGRGARQRKTSYIT